MDRLLILIESKSNREQIRKSLHDRYEIVSPPGEATLEEPIDLCILDRQALNRLSARFEDFRKDSRPAFLPFLLVTTHEETNLLPQALWQIVDDVIETPIRVMELQARVEVLLRSRRLSLEVQCLKEARLKSLETHLRLIVETSNIGLWDWNLTTNRVCYSSGWKRQIGYEPHEISDDFSEWQNRVHPEDLDRAVKTVQRYIANPWPDFREEFRFRHRDGSYRWILAPASLQSDSEGKPVRMLGCHVDITERKQAEEEREKLQAQLLQAQKMEAVGRLAGGVAHDFNNMLGVIIGRSDFVLSRMSPDAQFRHDLQEIHKAADRSADLTRQLLAFARKQTANPRILDLNDTVAGMLKMLRRLIGEDIDLAWMPGHELWSVKVDPTQIDQMLANLTVNARDAVVDVGRISIETTNVAVDDSYCADHAGFTPGEYVLLAVSDTGTGMDKDTLEHVFEPFFTTKEVGKGTGLGLATVYGIVKQNQGLVNVYSEPGRGTTFKIYLPRYRAETDQASSDTTEEKLRGGTETVLIVEDEKAILNLAKEILQQLGYTVLTADTPGQAIRLAAKYVGDIHLLITDVVMPEMNGQELAERLSRMKPNLKFLFMSGYTADVIAHHGVLDEGVLFIQKPFSLKALAKKTREALGDQAP